MTNEKQERILKLVARGEAERGALTAEVAGLRGKFDERRKKLRFAGTAVTAIATVVTVLYKLFGRGSRAARVGRLASAAGVLYQLSRTVFRAKRFW